MKELIALLGLCVSSVFVAPSSSSGADELTMTVTPSTDIAWLGQEIEVVTSGRPAEPLVVIAVCPVGVAITEPADVGTQCTILAARFQPALPTNRFEVDARIHPSCLDIGCTLTYATFASLSDAPADLLQEEITFTPVPPPPPSDPDFAMTVTVAQDFVDSLRLRIDVVNRNPATDSAVVALCQGDITADDFPSGCTTIKSSDDTDDLSVLTDVTRRTCADAGCSIVYSGAGSEFVPIAEFLVEPIAFTPSAIVDFSGNEDVVAGENINVVWQALNANQIPIGGGIAAPENYLGICLQDTNPSRPYSDRDCDGLDLGPDAVSGIADIPAQRFITTERLGVVDCLTYEYGCVIGYSLSYVDADGQTVLLDRDERPVTFRQQSRINDRRPSAPTGSPVSVVVNGYLPGQVAFVMLCGIGPDSNTDLRCSDLGTVEAPYDGEFDGTITLPSEFVAGGETFDCTTGRGCLVTFVATDENLALSASRGSWIRADDPTD